MNIDQLREALRTGQGICPFPACTTCQAQIAMLAALDVVEAVLRDGPISLQGELAAFEAALAGRKEGT